MEKNKEKKPDKKRKVAKVGGQALLEGVMMKGPSGMAIAVRNNKNEIMIETTRLKPRSKWRKVPVLRGVLAFIDSLSSGVGTIMKSAELLEENESEQISKGWMMFAVVLGLALGIGIFILLPKLLSDLLAGWLNFSGNRLLRSLISGVTRLVIFILYLVLVSLMKDIKRTFMYHGAEHRTISCYEHDMPLRVANVQKFSTRHDRCGTTFLFIVIIVSILIYAFTDYLFNDLIGVPDKIYYNMLLRLALLPFVAGLSYEILFGLAKLPDNWFVRALKAPGLWMQKLTTKIPDDGMAEVAIKSFNAAMAMENDPDLPPIGIDKYYMRMLENEIVEILDGVENIEKAEAEWIIAAACNLKRSNIAATKIINKTAYKEAINYAKQRAEGKPLSQILGVVSFYGIDIKVNNCVLSPRQETELLAERVIKEYKDGDKILDLCTGSGCIAIVVSDKTGAHVTASDISGDALTVARENADSRNIEFIKSDLFADLGGRRFNKIVCNPPYIASGDIESLDITVRGHEPHTALDGGADGLDFYRRIVKEAPGYLENGGKIYFETGYNQAAQVAEMLKQNGFKNIEIIKDYGNIERIVIAQLI